MRYLFYYRPNWKLFYRKFTEWVFHEFFHKTGKLLDIGCGEGYYLKEFKKLGFKTCGCDIEAINGVDKVNIETDVLPYNSDMFDYVFCKSVIEHLEHFDLLLTEIHRVLKKDGILFIQTWDWKRNQKNFWDDFTHKKPFTKFSLKSMLECYDFDVLIIKHMTHFPFIWRWSWRFFNMNFPFRHEMYAVCRKN